MGWLPRISRFGTVHVVFAQEGSQDCGLACARMVNFLIKKDHAQSAQKFGSMASIRTVIGSRMSD